MTFLENMMKIDRRWIYLAIGLAVIVPAFLQFSVPVAVSPEVKKIYDFVDNNETGKPLFLAMDYDPTSQAELNPMAEAVLKHAFARNEKVVIVTLAQFGPGMVQDVTKRIGDSMKKQYGIDYCFLGYRPYPAIIILYMGVDFRLPFPKDYTGIPLDSLPIMKGVKNYGSVKGVLDLTSGNTADMWLTDGNGRYGFPLAIGITGVMAANYYQYLQSGQLFGIMPGIKGAAEYEALIKKDMKEWALANPASNSKDSTALANFINRPGDGLKQAPYQVIAHSVIILFIILSNVAYFVTRRKAKIGGAK